MNFSIFQCSFIGPAPPLRPSSHGSFSPCSAPFRAISSPDSSLAGRLRSIWIVPTVHASRHRAMLRCGHADGCRRVATAASLDLEVLDQRPSSRQVMARRSAAARRGIASRVSASSCEQEQCPGGVHGAEMPPSVGGHFSLLAVTRAGQLWAGLYIRPALIGLRHVVRQTREQASMDVGAAAFVDGLHLYHGPHDAPLRRVVVAMSARSWAAGEAGRCASSSSGRARPRGCRTRRESP